MIPAIPALLRRGGAALLVALACALPVAAQPVVPVVGADASLDVGSWNLEWFGGANGPSDDERQFRNALSVLRQTRLDLWAVQEIADPADFERLVDSLGAPWRGALATVSGTQRIGFLYNADVVRAGTIEHLFTDTAEMRDFAGRPPLALSARVVLPDTSFDVLFITVHMKADGDYASWQARRAAADRIKNRLDFLYPSTAAVVLGDFNDELTTSISAGQTSPYAAFVRDAADYRFLTLPLDEAGANTYCFNADCTSGSTLDHILVTNELFPALVEGGSGRLTALLTPSTFLPQTTDHLPVYARFQWDTQTATEPDAPAVAPDVAVFPAPFRDRLHVRFTLGAAAPVAAELFDLAGRRVYALDAGLLPAGTHERTLAPPGLAAGAYVLRLRLGAREVSRLVVALL